MTDALHDPALPASIASIRARLTALDDARAQGALDDLSYAAARSEAERQLGAAVLAGPLPTDHAPTDRSKPSWRLVAGVMAVVLLVAVGGYAFTGSPSLAGFGKPPVAPVAAGEAANAPAGGGDREVGLQEIAQMIDRLAARLKDRPDDAEGWTMLARSYTVLTRYRESLPAYQRAVQLHPRGTLDKGAYQVIGDVFRKVEALEPYCQGAMPLADIAVLLLPEAPSGDPLHKGGMNIAAVGPSFEGAAATLAALKQQWNGETPDRDNLGRYKLVIIPDGGILEDEMRAKLAAFRAGGGAVLFSHEATLAGGAFALPDSPVQYLEPCPYTPSYMKLGDALGAGEPDTEFVNYQPGSYVQPANGAEALGEVWQPYFNRTAGHFSSHAQTPVDKPTGRPVAVLSADHKTAYVYAALFKGYRQDGFYLYKNIAARLLAALLPDTLVRPGANVPAAMEIAVLRQEAEGRLVIHLVNFQPQRRTAANEFIEDAVPLRDVSFALRTESSPARVFLAPSGEEIPFRQEGRYCHITVPAVLIAQTVVFEGV